MIRFNIDFRDKQCLSHLFLSLASKKKNPNKNRSGFCKTDLFVSAIIHKVCTF